MPLFTPGSSRSVSPNCDIHTPDNHTSVSASITNVLRLFEKSVGCDDGVDNAAKDIAGLVHSLNLIEPTMERIRTLRGNFKLARVYSLLIIQLRSLVGKPVPPISSRMVFVEVPNDYSPITLDFLKVIFPNIQKVWRILISGSGQRCLVEFASHSSARRAVDSRQSAAACLPHTMTHQAVRCAWACPFVAIPPLRVDYAIGLPLFEVVDDESIIAPSLDWRRPRPRSGSAGSIKTAEVFSVSDLLSILQGTGAFDDYPPQAAQLRF
jgi:hypothetical protein